MIRTLQKTRGLLIGAVFAVAACSGDSATNVQTKSSGDLSQIFSQLSLSGLSTLTTGFSGVASVAGPTPSNCTYQASSRSFTCAAVSANGLTLSQSYTLYDASGGPQSAFDATTTASIRVISSAKGTLSLPSGGGDFTIDGSQDMTMSGLLTSTRIMNGTSSTLMSGTTTVAGSAQVMSSKSTMTMTNITMPATATPGAYPTSGTMKSDNLSTFGGTTVHSVMTMTFDGTSKVVIVMTFDGTTQRCVMDMAVPGAMTCS